MKTIKYFLSVVLFVAAIISCTEEEFGSDAFVSTAVAPANMTALFDVTPDNTGLVTITPNSEGGSFYTVWFGDETAEPVSLKQGESTEHIYAEGTYQVKMVAKGVTGLTTEIQIPLVVSFEAPKNMVVTWSNDEATSNKVNVIAEAEFGISYDVYFGEEGNDEPVTANMGETASYTYVEPGTYTIRVVAKSASINTTEEILDVIATKIQAPLEKAPTPGKFEIDVVSIYSDAYTDVFVSDWNPDWGQSTVLSDFVIDGDTSLKYDFFNYTGIVTSYDDPTDASAMEYVHFDYWTNDATQVGLKMVNTSYGDGDPLKESEVITLNETIGEWVSIDIPLSEFTTDMSGITQFVLSSTSVTVFIDNLYFWKEPSEQSPLAGTWMFAPEAGAMGVGPAVGDYGWWSNNEADVITRACLFDDEYVLNADGSLQNILGSETWLEGWQGNDGESCGTPVAPHDGSNSATWTSTPSTITVNGLGAFLGLAKVHNGGEDGNPVDDTIVYDYVLSEDENSLDLTVNFGGGVWHFKLVRKLHPLVGSWKFAPEAGAMGVGPAIGDYGWWSNNEADVVTRACLFDDEYVISSNGSFANVLGSETWLEGWQGNDGESCGAPVAPHDGSNPATWSSTDSTITVNGLGAFLGLAKVHNGGEDGAPVDNTITYDYVLSGDGQALDLTVNFGGGVWHFKLIKQ